MVYDIIAPADDDGANDDDNNQVTSHRWRIQEESSCNCGDEDCYVGMFLHMEDYSGCEVGGSPGSISCDDEGDTTEDSTPLRPSISEQVTEIISNSGNSLSNGAIAGIVAAAALLLIVGCCCCFRRKKKNVEEEPVKATTSMEKSFTTRSIPVGGNGDTEATTEKKATPKKSRAAVASSTKVEASRKSRTGWMFGGKSNSNRSGNSAGTEENSQDGEGPDKKKRDSWFGKKPSNSEAVAVVESSKVTKTEPGKTSEQPEIKRGLFAKMMSNDVETATVKKKETSKKEVNNKKEKTKKKDEEDKNAEKKNTNETQTPEGNTEAVECTCCGL